LALGMGRDEAVREVEELDAPAALVVRRRDRAGGDLQRA
jgi:hypothetical protein